MGDVNSDDHLFAFFQQYNYEDFPYEHNVKPFNEFCRIFGYNPNHYSLKLYHENHARFEQKVIKPVIDGIPRNRFGHSLATAMHISGPHFGSNGQVEVLQFRRGEVPDKLKNANGKFAYKLLIWKDKKTEEELVEPAIVELMTFDEGQLQQVAAQAGVAPKFYGYIDNLEIQKADGFAMEAFSFSFRSPAARSLSFGLRKKLAFRAAFALCKTHEIGLIHRDLKSDNILVDDLSYRVVIADWATACKRMPYLKSPSKGARLFRAPELYQSNYYYDTLPDVWAFGLVLFELFGQGVTVFDYILNLELKASIDYLLSPDVYGIPKIVGIVSKLGLNLSGVKLLSCMLTQEKFRLTMREVVDHPFWDDVRAAGTADPPVEAAHIVQNYTEEAAEDETRADVDESNVMDDRWCEPDYDHFSFVLEDGRPYLNDESTECIEENGETLAVDDDVYVVDVGDDAKWAVAYTEQGERIEVLESPQSSDHQTEIEPPSCTMPAWALDQNVPLRNAPVHMYENPEDDVPIWQRTERSKSAPISYVPTWSLESRPVATYLAENESLDQTDSYYPEESDISLSLSTATSSTATSYSNSESSSSISPFSISPIAVSTPPSSPCSANSSDNSITLDASVSDASRGSAEEPQNDGWLLRITKKIMELIPESLKNIFRWNRRA